MPPLLVSHPVPGNALVFVTAPDDLDTEPHPPPQRQFTIVLAGEFEIETTDGERRGFGPGSVVLVEDTTGRGHMTRVRSGPATFAAVPLGE